MITQLDTPLPMDTPKGPAWAHFVIDYGAEHHLLWVCFIKESGQCWTFPNPQVLLEKNVTMGIRTTHVPPPCEVAGPPR